MSREYLPELSQKEEMRILRENTYNDPLDRRIRVFVSRKQWGRNCDPRNITLIDFDGNGQNFYQVDVDEDGHFKAKIYKDHTWHQGSDKFAETLFPYEDDPESKLRQYLGF